MPPGFTWSVASRGAAVEPVRVVIAAAVDVHEAAVQEPVPLIRKSWGGDVAQAITVGVEASAV